MKVTRQQLLGIVTWNEKVASYLHYINAWADTFEINTPLRISHFLAQCLHETCGLRYMTELGKEAYFKKYEQGTLGKRLGNCIKGDGYKYRGRGLLMTTGRANYNAYQKSGYCKGDIVSNPELLEQPCGAVKSAMWYWWKKGLNVLADKDDVLAVTKKINGGTNGLEDRKKWLEKCKKTFGV